MRAGLDILSNGGSARFKTILARYPGRDAVQVEMQSTNGSKHLRMGDEHKVDAAAAGLHAELKELLGADSVWEA